MSGDGMKAAGAGRRAHRQMEKADNQTTPAGLGNPGAQVNQQPGTAGLQAKKGFGPEQPAIAPFTPKSPPRAGAIVEGTIKYSADDLDLQPDLDEQTNAAIELLRSAAEQVGATVTVTKPTGYSTSGAITPPRVFVHDPDGKRSNTEFLLFSCSRSGEVRWRTKEEFVVAVTDAQRKARISAHNRAIEDDLGPQESRPWDYHR